MCYATTFLEWVVTDYSSTFFSPNCSNVLQNMFFIKMFLQQSTIILEKFAHLRQQLLVATDSGVRRKFSWGGWFHSVAYGGQKKKKVCIWCVLLMTSQFDVIFMFANQCFGQVCWHNMHILLLFKLPALQVRIPEENTPNATTQQFKTAKISGFALKHGSKTHSSLRQSNIELQNEVALMSCPLRAVEHTKCAAGLAGAHPVCKIESC